MRVINILCDGGLGNRLNSLIGGLITADLTQAKPVIFWPDNNWCGCNYTDLFQSTYEVSNQGINYVFNINKNSIYLIHENQIALPLERVYDHTYSNVQQISALESDIVYYHNGIPNWISESRILQVLQSIPINQAIVRKALEYCDKYTIDNDTWGILFRKTDYATNPAMNLNSDEICKHILSTPNTKYYICSDDKSTEDFFKNFENVRIYPKTEYVRKYKEGGWNDYIVDDQGRGSTFNVDRSRQSVIEAFIALLILSRTKIAIDIPSTFLDYAKLYSNINLTLYDKNNIK